MPCLWISSWKNYGNLRKNMNPILKQRNLFFLLFKDTSVFDFSIFLVNNCLQFHNILALGTKWLAKNSWGAWLCWWCSSTYLQRILCSSVIKVTATEQEGFFCKFFKELILELLNRFLSHKVFFECFLLIRQENFLLDFAGGILILFKTISIYSIQKNLPLTCETIFLMIRKEASSMNFVYETSNRSMKLRLWKIVFYIFEKFLRQFYF